MACLFSCSCVFSEGSNLTPAHHYSDFRFKTYAPIAFRYFRELFGIRPDDYLVSTLTHCHVYKNCSCYSFIRRSYILLVECLEFTGFNLCPLFEDEKYHLNCEASQFLERQ